mgnify:FL=1
MSEENKEILPEINFNNLSRGDINKIMRENYLEYAKFCVKDRAISDIRDGLKPVHRRILYSMLENKLYHNKPFEKVSKRVGYVMGEYHPHGDASITTALVNLSIPWKNNEPNIEILGNYGSIDGDSHGAPRYIECRLTKAGEEYGVDLNPNIIPYEPNYDNTKQIAVFLPNRLPQLLINGSEGLAVGIASNVLPHNPQEVIDTYRYFLKNPHASIEDLVNILNGPDFPTKGTIVNKDELLEIYKTGIGTVCVEGKIKYDKKKNALHIYEIPYTISGSITSFVATVSDMSEERVVEKDGKKERIPAKLPFITDVKSHSDINGLDIYIQLKKGTNVEYATNEIYKLTKLRSNLRFAFIGLNDKKVKLYNLKEYLEEFTETRLEILQNKHIFNFKELLKEEHKIQGYVKLQKVIDEVIACAKVVKGKNELITILKTGKLEKHHNVDKKYLETISKFDFSDEQANTIANLQIYRINKLNFDEYKKRLKQITEELKTEIRYIKDEDLRRQELIDNLPELNTPRQTQITNRELQEIKLEAQEIYYSFDGEELHIKQRKTPDSRVVKSNERLFAMADNGIVWNIYLDKLPKGKHKINKLFPTEKIVGIADKYSKILTIYDDGHMKYSNGEDYMTKSNAKKVNASNKLTTIHFINVDTDILINDKQYDNIPTQGIKGKGRKILKNTKDLTLKVIEINNEETTENEGEDNE